MRQKHLESFLSSLQREFPDPNIELEQYPTSAELAAAIVSFASHRGDVGPGRTVLDLGCGTGMLMAACAFVGSDVVVGVDCDSDAMQVARSNLQVLTEAGDDNVPVVEFLLGKVSEGSRQRMDQKGRQRQSRSSARKGKGRGKPHRESRSVPTAHVLDNDEDLDDGLPLQDCMVDTVLTNPPFGTKHNAGMDVRFLRAAIRLARRSVYSFHKTTTRSYLLRTCQKWGYTVNVVAEMKFDIPNTYKFHKRKTVDIHVDLLHISKTPAADVVDEIPTTETSD